MTRRARSGAAHHTLDIYGTELHVAYDRRAWGALRRRADHLPPGKDLGLGCTVAALARGTDQQHVWIFVDAWHPDHAGNLGSLVDTVAHEAAHAAEAILRRHSTPFGGEPAAYLVGWLARWIGENTPANSRAWPAGR